MVKYIFTFFIFSVFITFLYQQPSCSASNQKPQNIVAKEVEAKYYKLGQSIKKSRINHQFEINDFCQITGLSPSELESIEQGKKMPNKAKLYKIEEILETTFEIE